MGGLPWSVMAVPPCFSPEGYFNYVELAAATDTPSFCHDCTARYQARMLAADKCDHPETVFVEECEEDQPFLNRVALPESFVVGKHE